MNNSLTEGKILPALLRFVIPVFFSLFLQSLYGSVDMAIVGKFAGTGDVSGVASGSMLMNTVTNAVAGLAVGITVLIARRLGEGNGKEAGRAVGGGIALFSVLAVALTMLIPLSSGALARLMNAPDGAVGATEDYIRICGIGSAFVIAYNVLGGIFRGIGDSKTPLLTVAAASVFNVAGDLLLVGVFRLGSAGAAAATVASQGLSVLLSLVIIARRKLPIEFALKNIRLERDIVKEELRLGVPVAVQNVLSQLSFVVIQIIINGIDVAASAAAGIGDKTGGFMLLIPVAYMHALSAFVGQNLGAGKPERARRALRYSIITSVAVGAFMTYIAIFHGNLLAGIFSDDPAVISAAHRYIAGAYGFDCIVTSVVFCFVGYYNGCGKTLFVLLQGLLGAFAVRVPFALFVSRLPNADIFAIGLSTPVSSAVQMLICLAAYKIFNKKSEPLSLDSFV